MNKTLCLALATLIGLSACSAERVSLFPSYKLKVIQGNELDPRAVVSLQAGMSRDQVQLLLGTSRNGIIKDRSNLTVYFENDVLVRAEGDAIQKSIETLQAEQRAAQTAQ